MISEWVLTQAASSIFPLCAFTLQPICLCIHTDACQLVFPPPVQTAAVWKQTLPVPRGSNWLGLKQLLYQWSWSEPPSSWLQEACTFSSCRESDPAASSCCRYPHEADAQNQNSSRMHVNSISISGFLLKQNSHLVTSHNANKEPMNLTANMIKCHMLETFPFIVHESRTMLAVLIVLIILLHNGNTTCWLMGCSISLENQNTLSNNMILILVN